MADRTYDAELLPNLDPTSLEWARNWARFLLRDRPEIDKGGVPLGAGQPARQREATWPQFSRTDRELEAALKLDAVTAPSGQGYDLEYFRPHLTAAKLYLGDPNLWRTRAVDGTSETRRDAKEIVTAWMAQGMAIDALIPVGNLPGLEPETAASKAERLGSTWVYAPGGW